MPAERNGPYRAQHIALQNARLAGSSRSRRNASDAAMRTISIEEVCAACDHILDRAIPTAPAKIFSPFAAMPSATAA